MKSPADLSGFVKNAISRLRLAGLPAVFCAASFVASVAAVIAFASMDTKGRLAYGDLETGMVADRDVIAPFQLSFVDEGATAIRTEAQRKMVPAVFRYLPDVSEDVLSAWNAFSDFADSLEAEETSIALKQLSVQAEYGSFFSGELITSYFNAVDRQDFRDYGSGVLASVLEKRVFVLGGVDLGGHNPDTLELLTVQGDRTERERIARAGIVSLQNARDAIAVEAESLQVSEDFAAIAGQLLLPFIKANAVFSQEDTQIRISETLAQVPPVTRTIEQGQRLIRQGFIISAENMQDLQALRSALPVYAPRGHAGKVLLLALVYLLFVFLHGRQVLGKRISDAQASLVFVLLFLYVAGSGLVQNLLPASGFPVSLFFPTALFVMIPAVLSGHLAALLLALALPLAASTVGFFDTESYIFALVSGIAAAVVLRKAEKRMDLIKAGMKIAAANSFAALVILLTRSADLAVYPPTLLWAILNGIVCGMLILGVLAPLEHFLNAPTNFRLIELSDLNAPLLRKLFTTAPGTYSHSVMVATLAEEACKDIGANALLARVGAYYHDIGKMENPEYFVENQTDYNRHDDIAPRLSATVIRSHLKIGAEKARQLGLPEEVVDIVCEHHGNSLITWFYRKAQEQEGQVNPDDFTYPGTPPGSKEAAVVMLADVAEAAVRTLEKPNAAKMEKFIQQLIDDKVEHGQLARCDLTFRDLATIKGAFVKVLAGYYHSRIEYPKPPAAPVSGEEAAQETPA